MGYHSNYYEKGDSHRSDLDTRLKAILSVLQEKYVLDIGCSGGYFDFGIYENVEDLKYLLAIDKEKDLIFECDRIAQNNNVEHKVEFKVQDIADYIANPCGLVENGEPNCCLYMSTHHHVINAYGMEVATFMLKLLCQRFKRVIFDMGQKNEEVLNCSWWQRLPKTLDQEQWLMDYLWTNTECSRIKVIGTSVVHGVERYLFNLETE